MRTMIRRICLLACCLILVILTGCKTEKTDIKKIKDLEFTVLEEADVPKEFMKRIEEKKAEAFKMTFQDDEYFYIAVGYGTKSTGGYSIAVKALYLTKNAIYINTELIGPDKDEEVTEATSTPFIVVKLKEADENVVFE